MGIFSDIFLGKGLQRIEKAHDGDDNHKNNLIPLS
jgi:hypothetical protein